MSCPFFDIPVELRLHIYSFALLLDQPTISIGSAKLEGTHPDIIHRLYGGKRTPFPSIPEGHEPVVRLGYHASLLSVVNPAVIDAAKTHDDDKTHEYPHTAHLALLLVNKQINEELMSHFKLAKNRNTSLFLSYPDGLHICRTLTPHLLRQARSVHIAGTYVSRTFCPVRAACLGPRQRNKELDVKYNGGVIPPSAKQLGELICSLFGPQSTHSVQKLELRVYYPGDDSYSTVWGDDSSPIVLALRNIYAGDVGIEVWRGRSSGTGVYLTARPNVVPDGLSEAEAEKAKKRRVVSTVWRRLEEGRRNEPKEGSWIVDSKWPEWEDGYEMSDGPKGDLIINE